MNTALKAVTAVIMLSAGSAIAAPWGLPFKGEDFRDDERLYWHRPIHSPSGVQKNGYDLEIRRYDSNAKLWKPAKGSKNSDWYIYDRPVYAMQSGSVIACWRNAPENPKTGTGEGKWHEELTKHPEGGSRIYGGGNGFWIEHADGSRAEYAHFRPGTVPAALCPHNDELLPEVVASPDVRHAWPHIRVDLPKPIKVKQGDFLGRSGNTGTSSNPHLHIHREEGGEAGTKKSGGSPLEIDFASGLYAPYDEKGPYVKWTSFAGKPIPPGPVLVWPSVSKAPEYARHGFAAEGFGVMFQHLADSGYWPVWIDYYDVGGKTFVNHIWRPATQGYLTYLLDDKAVFQKNAEDAVKAGFNPAFVESSNTGGARRFTGVFVKNLPGDFLLKHDISEAAMQGAMKDAVKRGLSPVSVSVIPAGNELRYTVLFRPQSTNWVIKPAIPEDDYQAEFNTQTKAGRRPVSVSAYVFKGKPHLCVAFAAVTVSDRKDRHLMSSREFQDEWEAARKAGMLTRSVTSFDGAQTQHRFAAAWWK